MILQSLKMAWKSIITNKMRSFLTMLGIIIGVIALVVLVSLVSGTTESVKNSISSIGTNLLTVTISDDKGRPVKLSDLDEIAENSDISEAAPIAQTSITAKSRYSSETAAIYGTTASYKDIAGLTLSSGRFIKKTDVDNHTNVAVISSDLATDVMGRTDVTDETISLDGKNYLIIGVLKADDSTTSTYSDYKAYIPYTSLIRLTDTVSTSITTFCVSAADENSTSAAETTLNNILYERFNEDEDAYSIQNESEIQEAMESVTNTLALLLGGIAAISLLVGGIGIMNIMLVSVTERTREIGIRKAIGAGRGTILTQFLIEALMISLIGCGIGIFGSWIILKIASVFATSYNLSFSLSMNVVWIAIAFSTAIGVIFGLYPANKAARKSPIEALRYAG